MIDCRAVALKEAEGPVEAELEEEKVEVIKTPEELEEEKEQLLREELAQARINQLAKKKKSKKKVNTSKIVQSSWTTRCRACFVVMFAYPMNMPPVKRQ